MNNAEKFQEVFGYYATEMWAKPESEFLEWINSEYVPTIEVIEKQVASKLKNADDSLLTEDTEMDKEQESKLYIPLNQHTVERINRLHKNECGDYFDEEWLYNELEQIAVIFQLSPETPTNKVDTPTDPPTDTISRQAAIEALTGWETDPTDEEIEYTLKALPVEPKRPKGEWIPCTEPPKDKRNVFLAHGTNDFKSCCIGHYEQGMGWYEDRNFFAKPIYDCKYWCDIPDLPDMGDYQFDMRGNKE